MKVSLASDHAGYKMKEEVKSYLEKKGYEVKDYGTFSEESMDYPDTIKLAARAVSKREVDRGVVLCASGIGASIVANKIKGVRAALCLDEYSAEYSRRHNNANVLVLGAKRNTKEEILRIIDIWFSTEFEGGRHERRVEKIAEVEKEEMMD
ncbi:MAG: ribose 5-phosphate isomerase B [Brevinematales bacterium]|nr:ribose 5-phosphate isomerase B [Brevinematales bacterium]